MQTPVTKRLVYWNGDLPVIMGNTDQFQGQIPVTVGPFEAPTTGRVEFASLVRVDRRAAHYKAPMVPKSYGSMHPDQQ